MKKLRVEGKTCPNKKETQDLWISRSALEIDGTLTRSTLAENSALQLSSLINRRMGVLVNHVEGFQGRSSLSSPDFLEQKGLVQR